jgi:SAM-dependent methyltransferase
MVDEQCPNEICSEMSLTAICNDLDNIAKQGGDLYTQLRTLPVDMVGEILLGPEEKYQHLVAALPRMAPKEVQMAWTGSYGRELLLQSCAFIRAAQLGYFKYTGKTLDDAKILDYGCGWGRLTRFLYAFTAPENIFACDPWQPSLDACITSGLKVNLALCEEVPIVPPFSGMQFDFIFAFSVFTHLNESAALSVLNICRQVVKKDGIMALTIRPFSYWDLDIESNRGVNPERMKTLHMNNQFAFSPHETRKWYGDSSMSLNYIRDCWPEWTIAGVDFNLQDPYQIIVFLRPKF